MAESKTNAMRMLERAGVTYTTRSYDHSDGLIDGVSVAHKLGQPVETVYKTLVTRSGSGTLYVFVLAVNRELNLKKAARAVGEKSVEMVPVSELLKLTGYVRGGCSPVGMKKLYRTVIDQAALQQERIAVSAGRIGQQIQLAPRDLALAVDAAFADLLAE